MNYLLSGFQLGLLLSLLVGPLLIALIQTSIEEGIRAGTMVGLGIWISDFMFICLVYCFLSFIDQVSQHEYFELFLCIFGGLILIGIGIANFFIKSSIDFEANNYQRTSSYTSLWVKGFAINTFNPFTVVFWTGISSNILIIEEEERYLAALLFFGGILGVIILTDFLKVVLAKRIRIYLNPTRIGWVRKISGLLLIVFGVALIGRVVF